MARVHYDIARVIARPVEEIWNFVNDLHNDPKWWVQVKEVRRLSQIVGGVGERIHQRATVLGVPFDYEVEVTEWKPYERVGQRVTGGLTPYTSVYLFEAVEGGARFRLVADVEFRGLLAWLRPLAMWHLSMVGERNFDRLKRLLESGGGVASGSKAEKSKADKRRHVA